MEISIVFLFENATLGLTVVWEIGSDSLRSLSFSVPESKGSLRPLLSQISWWYCKVHSPLLNPLLLEHAFCFDHQLLDDATDNESYKPEAPSQAGNKSCEHSHRDQGLGTLSQQERRAANTLTGRKQGLGTLSQRGRRAGGGAVEWLVVRVSHDKYTLQVMGCQEETGFGEFMEKYQAHNVVTSRKQQFWVFSKTNFPLTWRSGATNWNNNNNINSFFVSPNL